MSDFLISLAIAAGAAGLLFWWQGRRGVDVFDALAFYAFGALAMTLMHIFTGRS